MRARITRTIPDASHHSMADMPSAAAEKESFYQVAMTKELRAEMGQMGFETLYFEVSRKLPADEAGDKRYQFEVTSPMPLAEANEVVEVMGFDGGFSTVWEAVEIGEPFDGDEAATPSAIASVGNLVR